MKTRRVSGIIHEAVEIPDGPRVVVIGPEGPDDDDLSLQIQWGGGGTSLVIPRASAARIGKLLIAGAGDKNSRVLK